MSRWSKAVALGILTGVVGLVISLSPLGVDLEENVGLDILFKLRGTRQPPAEVIVVSIGRDSAVHLNQPDTPEKWPRLLHANLTENLLRAGAAVIAFDIFFDEARAATDDQTFANAIRQARNVVLFGYLKRERLPWTGKSQGAASDLYIESLVPPGGYCI